jgi:hypothetical protein
MKELTAKYAKYAEGIEQEGTEGTEEEGGTSQSEL